ncbi:hypothetical protein [Actinosynnema sp. NPDC020468]|uniref:hypothetical protein n=1 Tax=Actinosynnema sp. NPDC020468 TaxID=3154488 RepID=UPI0033ED9F67
MMRFLIALLALALVTAPAAEAAPRVITGHATALHPEGIARAPQGFLVGSMTRGTVELVRRDGSTTTLASDPAMVSTFGLHVANGRIYVAYADMGVGPRSTPATAYHSSGLGIFDLRTGRTLRVVDLAIGAGKHTANDVALDRAGNAYVTDPSSDTLYEVDARGRATAFLKDPRLASTSIGLNGVTWHPAGFLIAGRYDTGTLFKIPLDHPEAFTEITTDRALVGADGIQLRPDGGLTVVTNSLGAQGTPAVTVLRSTDGWRTARTTRRVELPGTQPTTVDGDRVVDGDLEVLLAGGTSDTFTLRRF